MNRPMNRPYPHGDQIPALVVLADPKPVEKPSIIKDPDTFEQDLSLILSILTPAGPIPAENQPRDQ